MNFVQIFSTLFLISFFQDFSFNLNFRAKYIMMKRLTLSKVRVRLIFTALIFYLMLFICPVEDFLLQNVDECAGIFLDESVRRLKNKRGL